MKKAIAMLAAFSMTAALAACGNTSPSAEADDTSTVEETTSGEVGMPNPWSEAKSAEEAAEGAGVGYFLVPEDGMEVEGGPVYWNLFRYMEEIAEADGSVGAAELTVRKGLNQNGDDVSGDYNEYAHTWEIEADGWKVKCAGNEEGKVMKATWISDNFSYAIMVRAQGDDEELLNTYGLSDDDIATLVSAIQ